MGGTLPSPGGTQRPNQSLSTDSTVPTDRKTVMWLSQITTKNLNSFRGTPHSLPEFPIREATTGDGVYNPPAFFGFQSIKANPHNFRGAYKVQALSTNV